MVGEPGAPQVDRQVSGAAWVLSWFGVPTPVGLLGGKQGLWMGQGS